MNDRQYLDDEQEEQLYKLRIAQMQRALDNKRNKKKKLQKKQEAIQERDPIISEHAYLRYCQRVLGIDGREVRDKLLCPEILQMLETLGPDGEYPHPDGFIVVFKNKKVITILNAQ